MNERTYHLGELLRNKNNNLVYEVILTGDRLIGVQDDEGNILIIDPSLNNDFELYTESPVEAFGGVVNNYNYNKNLTLDEIKLEIYMEHLAETDKSKPLAVRIEEALSTTNTTFKELYK